jgi:hypothetical protein
MNSSTSTKTAPVRTATAKTAKCALVGGHTAHGACDGAGRPSPKPVVTRTDADRENSVIAGLATAPSPAKSARTASAARKATVKAATALPTRESAKAEADAKIAKGTAADKPASPKPAKEISRKAEMARAMVNALVPVLKGFSPEEQQAAVNMIHHFPTGKTATGARYWPEGILRPDRSDWK